VPVTAKQAADKGFRRANGLLALADHEDLPIPRARTELRRAALVAAVSALDTYLHVAVLRKLTQHKEMPAALGKLEMPFSELATLADAWIERQQDEDAPRARPYVRVKNALRRKLLTISFQGSRSVENALSMCGVKKPWKTLGRKLGLSAKQLKAELDKIVHRRNQIAHESDIARMDRPRHISLNSLSQTEARTMVDWLLNFVVELDRIV
jgi:hypothetical protein